jgi:hypothetical protein
MLVELVFSANQVCDDIKLYVRYLDRSWIVDCTTDTQTISLEIPDGPMNQQHQIVLEMTGKSSAHTSIDDQGNIIKDIMFNIDSIVFDQIDVHEIFCNGKQIYTHDFNGTQQEFLDDFYGKIGCNGTVVIDFTTPIHLWFLEHI